MTDQGRTTVCLGCGCLCDDILVTDPQDPNRWTNLCDKGRRWASRPVPSGTCWLGGQPVSLEAGLERIVELFSAARAPHFESLSELCTEAQQLVVDLAELRAATIEVAPCCGSSTPQITARQGWVTATLGEIRERSDLVICWFCDPAESHPRFFERYVNDGARRFVIDLKETATGRLVEKFWQMTTTEALPVVSELRRRIAGNSDFPVQSPALNQDSENAIDELANALSSCHHATHLIGELVDPVDWPLADCIASLAREWNKDRCSVAVRLMPAGNGLAAETVLGWMSGAVERVQFPVDRKSAVLSYAGGGALARQQADLVFRGPGCLEGAGEGRANRPACIWLVDDAAGVEAGLEKGVDVILAVAQPGLAGGGSWMRMDHLSLPLFPVRTDPGIPDAREVLRSLRDRLAQLDAPISGVRHQ